jgi:phosphatidylserine/phosphatidylglycerophosphate/cardiolipin synthase-like enzyme
MIALLHAAVHRGVVVEIIIPKDTDVSTINYINYYYVEKMFQL